MTRTHLILTTAIAAIVLAGLTAYAQTDTSATRPSATDAERFANEAPSQQGPMNDQMMARCRVMSRTAISPSDSVAILAQRERLGLSDEQVAELQRIAESARKQARSVLNETQTDELGTLPDKPESMMQMHQRMMRQMTELDSSDWSKENHAQTCPMHGMMRDGKGRADWEARSSSDRQSRKGRSHSRKMNMGCCR